MDKCVIFAVAGSGKTTYLIDRLTEESRAIVLTYTENNYKSIKNRVRDKFGYLPKNIRIMTYFSFIYSFCYRPFLLLDVPSKGLFFKEIPEEKKRLPLSNPKRYITNSGFLFHNRLAKLVDEKEATPKIAKRLKKYFDIFLVDEVQDFAGHDFNLIEKLMPSEVSMCFVGDFYQHTYDTSRDGSVNQTLHDDFSRYVKRFSKNGVHPSLDVLDKSHRCCKEVCDFVRNNLCIKIQSHGSVDGSIFEVSDKERILELVRDDDIVKLVLQNAKKKSYFSRNWGETKGEDNYGDVCVVLNQTTYLKFRAGKLHELKPITRNKLYVAITRSRGNVYLIREKTLQEVVNSSEDLHQ